MLYIGLVTFITRLGTAGAMEYPGTLHFRRNKAVAALELGTVVPVDQSTVDALGTAGLVVLVELRTVVPVEPAQRSYYYNTDSTT